MRSHLGCTGSVALGQLGDATKKRLEQVAASWLEFSPDTSSLIVRHVQPDDLPPIREVAGELLDFLHVVTEPEREHMPGGALFYQDEPTGQYVRMKVWEGGFLTFAWARPDYSQARWETFANQPVRLVFEPFQRLNGAVSFEGNPSAADDFRKILDEAAGDYSQGDYAITSSVRRVEITLRDLNVDTLTVVNALRYMAKPGTLTGELDISSFRTGDLEDYCRFAFRGGETWMARPALWPETPESTASAADDISHAA